MENKNWLLLQFKNWPFFVMLTFLFDRSIDSFIL